MLFNKSFFIGLGAGVALTMVALAMWGKFLNQHIESVAQSKLVTPLHWTAASSARLPKPWVPATGRLVHDRWSVRPLGGEPGTLSELKGKVVFLNFWSTSCTPCIAEMPGIERLHESMKSEPVAFLAVTQEEEKVVRSFLQEVPLRVPIYLGDKAAPADLRAVAFPSTFILDRDGRVVYREVGAKNWDDEDVRIFIRNLEKQ
jgi:thiol-disulfide isomerase/thioredoxin